MDSDSIIKHLNIFKNHMSGLRSGFKFTMMGEFGFQGIRRYDFVLINGDNKYMDIMAILLQITHTVKPIPNPQNRIEKLDGIWSNSNAPFSYTEDEVIRMVEAGKTRPDALKFVVKVDGVVVPVTVALRNGSKYLKTAADSSSCNILLSLPSS